MVRVTPHSYVLRSGSWLLPGTSSGAVLDVYFVGGAEAGYFAWPDSWILDDRHQDVPYNERRLAGDVFYGTEVRADPDEVAGWKAAQVAAEAALRDAEARLLHDHGLIEIRDDSSRRLRPAPGWRARARRWSPHRSRRASAGYRERIWRIALAYRPTRDEIEARVREAQQQAAERWERMRAVAARVLWSYRVDRVRGTVDVFHEDGATLDARALADKLLEVRRDTGVATLRWDDQARAEVARSTGVDLDTWWRAVAPRPWTDSQTIPRTRTDHSGRVVHVSTHTSFGVGTSPPSAHT